MNDSVDAATAYGLVAAAGDAQFGCITACMSDHTLTVHLDSACEVRCDVPSIVVDDKPFLSPLDASRRPATTPESGSCALVQVHDGTQGGTLMVSASDVLSAIGPRMLKAETASGQYTGASGTLTLREGCGRSMCNHSAFAGRSVDEWGSDARTQRHCLELGAGVAALRLRKNAIGTDVRVGDHTGCRLDNDGGLHVTCKSCCFRCDSLHVLAHAPPTVASQDPRSVTVATPLEPRRLAREVSRKFHTRLLRFGEQYWAARDIAFGDLQRSAAAVAASVMLGAALRRVVAELEAAFHGCARQCAALAVAKTRLGSVLLTHSELDNQKAAFVLGPSESAPSLEVSAATSADASAVAASHAVQEAAADTAIKRHEELIAQLQSRRDEERRLAARLSQGRVETGALSDELRHQEECLRRAELQMATWRDERARRHATRREIEDQLRQLSSERGDLEKRALMAQEATARAAVAATEMLARAEAEETELAALGTHTVTLRTQAQALRDQVASITNEAASTARVVEGLTQRRSGNMASQTESLRVGLQHLQAQVDVLRARVAMADSEHPQTVVDEAATRKAHVTQMALLSERLTHALAEEHAVSVVTVVPPPPRPPRTRTGPARRQIEKLKAEAAAERVRLEEPVVMQLDRTHLARLSADQLRRLIGELRSDAAAPRAADLVGQTHALRPQISNLVASVSGAAEGRHRALQQLVEQCDIRIGDLRMSAARVKSLESRLLRERELAAVFSDRR